MPALPSSWSLQGSSQSPWQAKCLKLHKVLGTRHCCSFKHLDKKKKVLEQMDACLITRCSESGDVLVLVSGEERIAFLFGLCLKMNVFCWKTT